MSRSFDLTYECRVNDPTPERLSERHLSGELLGEEVQRCWLLAYKECPVVTSLGDLDDGRSGEGLGKASIAISRVAGAAMSVRRATRKGTPTVCVPSLTAVTVRPSEVGGEEVVG